jgi:hypothetical protein
MFRTFALFFLAIGFLSVIAQSDNYDRCDVSRIEDTDQFEHWLYSKQMIAATLI